jgi:glycosyltransferase involved in cell wall biosynthesis
VAAERTSVVIPCYDDGATLGETVDSIREGEAVEIIVVDDGSRDPATIQLLDALAAEGRIRLVRKPNGGVASALRAGFAAAVTPYVFVIASDDLVDAGAIGDLADALDRSPDDDFAFGHSHHFGDVDFVRKAAPWNPWILLYSNLWEAACLFRREPVIEAGGFPDGTGYEDWALFMALAERGSMGVLVDRLVFHYRIHGGGRVNQGAKSRFGEHYRALRHDHPALFALEPVLRRRYPLPLWTRLLYRLQLQIGLHAPPALVRPLLNVKYRLRPLVAWVDAARR